MRFPDKHKMPPFWEHDVLYEGGLVKFSPRGGALSILGKKAAIPASETFVGVYFPLQDIESAMVCSKAWNGDLVWRSWRLLRSNPKILTRLQAWRDPILLKGSRDLVASSTPRGGRRVFLSPKMLISSCDVHGTWFDSKRVSHYPMRGPVVEMSDCGRVVFLTRNDTLHVADSLGSLKSYELPTSARNKGAVLLRQHGERVVVLVAPETGEAYGVAI